MNVQTLQYCESGGFSAPIGHQLDAERTLVLVFASPEFDQNLKPLEAIAAACPRSVVVGCSTAGEIVGTRLTDPALGSCTRTSITQNGASCCELHNQTMTITTISERN